MQQIDRERLPQHIAIIMDGNGRWAKERGKARLFGHQSAIQSVREVSEGCAELGVGYLTLYAFSTDVAVGHHHHERGGHDEQEQHQVECHWRLEELA